MIMTTDKAFPAVQNRLDALKRLQAVEDLIEETRIDIINNKPISTKRHSELKIESLVMLDYLGDLNGVAA
jgi:hypothetical protein